MAKANMQFVLLTRDLTVHSTTIGPHVPGALAKNIVCIRFAIGKVSRQTYLGTKTRVLKSTEKTHSSTEKRSHSSHFLLKQCAHKAPQAAPGQGLTATGNCSSRGQRLGKNATRKTATCTAYRSHQIWTSECGV